MKRLISILLLFCLSTFLFAFPYGQRFYELFNSFKESNIKIEIILLTKTVYKGYVKLAREDYFLLYNEEEDLIIISYNAISEVVTISNEK
jgi:hypothetical protein